MSRNVGKELPVHAAWQPRMGNDHTVSTCQLINGLREYKSAQTHAISRYKTFEPTTVVSYLVSMDVLYRLRIKTHLTKLLIKQYKISVSPHKQFSSTRLNLLNTKRRLTYSMEQSPFEKLTGFAANQEIPRILWKWKVHYRTHKRPPTVPVLSIAHIHNLFIYKHI